VRIRYITDLWFVLPDPLFDRLLRWLDIAPDDAHEWLCDVWGCRCG
jgi:hypothetical protein